MTADGKALPAGTYQVRLTRRKPSPAAVGITEPLERWVEFVQGGAVKGREVVSIVPQAEVKMVVKDAPPPAGGSKVQMLKGQRLRAGLDQQGREPLPDLPAGVRRRQRGCKAKSSSEARRPEPIASAS